MEIQMHQRFKLFCLGKLRSNPWSELDGLHPETKIINEQLCNVNLKGFLTINSQPAVNGAKSDSPSVGNVKFLFVNVIICICNFVAVDIITCCSLANCTIRSGFKIIYSRLIVVFLLSLPHLHINTSL